MISSNLSIGALLLSFCMTLFASPIQLSRRDISSELLDDFKLFAQFAALAACDQNINSTGNKLTCDYGLCGLVEADDTETIDAFHNSTAATGYVALDHTKKLILLTFRGTITKHDGDTDFQFLYTSIEDVCPGCKAHSGFWTYWKSAEERAIVQLQKATKSHPDYGVAVVGHSLGGAVATLAGTVLRQKGFTLDIWTFGGPKVGNKKLAEFITNQRAPVSVYRATHASDIVPRLPLTGIIFDYSQPSPEYWINQPTGDQVTTDVVKYIEGINSIEGNAGQSGIRWPDPNHGWYFGNMSICLPPADKPAD